MKVIYGGDGMQIKRNEHLYARVTPDVKEAAKRPDEAEGIALSTLVFEAVRGRVQGQETRQKDKVQG